VNRRKRTAGDEDIVNAAARAVGIRIAAACALAIAVVAVLAFTLIGHHSPAGGVPLASGDRDDDNDALVRNALLVAGAVGIVIAGFVGWWAARNAVRPLGQALALQRRFIADAGHELRTPLTILHTRAQLLARRIRADDPARPVVEQLLDDSRVLAEIVEELLASASLTEDPTRAEPVDTADLVTDVAASIAILAQSSGVELQTRTSPGVIVDGSRTALRRALLALADNAVAHTPAGGTVMLSCRSADGRAIFEITDTGEGIDPEDADRLMERFARGATTLPAGPGKSLGGKRFGIGLSLVREIATAHSGTLELTGTPGDGARATLTFPAADSPEARTDEHG
jgi:two-component system OmpR family sensor kinase